jgi:hypothetical protein
MSYEDSDKQRQQQPVVVSVWEGEWPALKSAVSSVRRATGSSLISASEYVDFQMYRSVALDTVAKADATAVQQSKRIGVAYRSNPWVVPVTGICATSLFVYSKSLRWGVAASMRNSAITAAVLTLGVFPHEVRQVCTDLVTSKPL